MPRSRKYPEELLDRGVRLALESGRPIAQVARDLGVGSEALRKRVRQAEVDAGKRTDLLTTAEREEIRKLRKENFELRRANEILKSASLFFARELDTDRGRRIRSRRLTYPWRLQRFQSGLPGVAAGRVGQPPSARAVGAPRNERAAA